MDTSLLFPREMQAYGRNGTMRQIGIDINPVSDYVNLWPVNRKGFSESVLLQIPVESIDDVILKLQEAKTIIREGK